MKKLMALALCLVLLCVGTTFTLAEDAAEVIPSDYSDFTNWLAIPEITKDVDTFYIYPTAFMDASEGAPVICEIDSEILRTGAKGCYETQGILYEESTNVFASYYRQINMVVAATAPAEEREALLEGAISINPLNWKRDETYAGKELCLGARILNAETGETYFAHGCEADLVAK